MNIDNLMDQLIAEGVSFEKLSKAFDDAHDRKVKRDTAAIETARANVMQTLRKYLLALYGECDEAIMAEFETTLKGLEKTVKKPNTFHMSMNSGDVDEEKLKKFLKSIAW